MFLSYDHSRKEERMVKKQLNLAWLLQASWTIMKREEIIQYPARTRGNIPAFIWNRLAVS